MDAYLQAIGYEMLQEHILKVLSLLVNVLNSNLMGEIGDHQRQI